MELVKSWLVSADQDFILINGNMKELCEFNRQSLKSCLFFLIHICIA